MKTLLVHPLVPENLIAELGRVERARWDLLVIDHPFREAKRQFSGLKYRATIHRGHEMCSTLYTDAGAYWKRA